MLTKPIGSIVLDKPVKLLKPKRCKDTSCKMIWLHSNGESVIYGGFLWFNCKCGSTFVDKRTQNGAISTETKRKAVNFPHFHTKTNE